jgi:3-phenylpropionate/trans-cinnamate dioxygenase ferredoxin component
VSQPEATAPSDFRRVCSTTDIPEGTMSKIDLGDREVMVANIGGRFHAADTWCTHQRSDLSMGLLADRVVMCPLHQARFDLENGKVLDGPSGDDPSTIPALAIYEVKVEGTDVFVKF